MSTVLSSAVIAAIVAAFISVLTSERRIGAENVIQERKNWRDKIRELSSEIFKLLIRVDSTDREDLLRDMRAEFSLLLNPHSISDQNILLLIAPNGADKADEFTQRVALLLKHDWERAKREASLWRRLWEKEPGPVSFEHFRPGCKHNYRNGRFF
jgi:hypothetical protein